MHAKVSAKMIFEAAHRMPHFPKGHPNERWHGHTYTVRVFVEGAVQPETGMVIDHGELEAAMMSLHEQLDHRALNEIPGLELPTSENIAHWIWVRLKPQFAGLCEILVERELRGIVVSYRGQD